MTIHRLKMRRVRGGDVGKKRAGRRRRRNNPGRMSGPAAGQINSGNKAGGGGFHVAFNPCKLPGKEEVLIAAELEGGQEKFRGVNKGIAVHHPVPDKFRLF